jgi:hypothetical protein
MLEENRQEKKPQLRKEESESVWLKLVNITAI